MQQFTCIHPFIYRFHLWGGCRYSYIETKKLRYKEVWCIIQNQWQIAMTESQVNPVLAGSLYLPQLVHYHDSGSIISFMYPKSLYKARSEIELTCSFVDIFNVPKGTRPLTVGMTIKGCLMVIRGASLVLQWLGICLPVQGTWVRSLVWKDPTCQKDLVQELLSLCHSTQHPGVCELQLLKPTHRSPCTATRHHRNEKPAYCNERAVPARGN